MGESELMGICYAAGGLRAVLGTTPITAAQSSLESHSKKLRALLRTPPPTSDFAQHTVLQSKAKDIIRKGVPTSLIRDLAIGLWTLPIASREYLNIRAQQLETETYAAECPTFSRKQHLNEAVPLLLLSTEGVEALQRVLWAISETSKGGWFCPILPCLASLSLLFLSETESFLLLTALTKYSESTPPHPNLNWHFLFTETQHKRLFTVIRDLLRDKERTLVTTLEARGVDVALLAGELVSSLYIGRVHWLTLCRLYCCYLSEGTRILVRFTVGVFRKLKPQLLGLASVKDVLAAITIGLNTAQVAEAAFKAGVSLHMPKVFPTWLKNGTEPDSVPLQVTFDRLQTVVDSVILSQGDFQRLWQELPPRYKLMSLHLTYSSDRDGIHLPTLLRKSAAMGEHPGSILLFSTLQEWTFGVFLDTWVRPTPEFIGTSDCFFFTMKPTECFAMIETENVYVLHVTPSQLTIGEGPHGPALSLDSDLSRGYSATSATFRNPTIETGTFILKSCELFSLTY